MFQEEEATHGSMSEVEGQSENLSMSVGAHWTLREEMALMGGIHYRALTTLGTELSNKCC